MVEEYRVYHYEIVATVEFDDDAKREQEVFNEN